MYLPEEKRSQIRECFGKQQSNAKINSRTDKNLNIQTVHYYCEECGILFVVNRFEKKICCPKGGKEKVIAYDDKKICNSKGNVVFFWDIATIRFL